MKFIMTTVLMMIPVSILLIFVGAMWKTNAKSVIPQVHDLDTDDEWQNVLDPAKFSGDEVSPELNPMHVKDLYQGKATLVVRHLKAKGKVVAHLYLWNANTNKRSKKVVPAHVGLSEKQVGPDATEDLFDLYISEAKEKIAELENMHSMPKEKKGVTKKLPVEDTSFDSAMNSENIQCSLQTETEDFCAGETKMYKNPKLFRGIVKDIGMFDKHLFDGTTTKVFGVKLSLENGEIQTIYGRGLEKTLRVAKIYIGDKVEITKVGRRFMEAGKAPMGIFKIVRLF